MALIDTREAGSTYLDTKSGMVQSIRLAIVEEFGAANTYERLATGIRQSGWSNFGPDGKPVEVPDGRLSVEQANKLAESIMEIADDELRHVGKLMRIIEELSPEDKVVMDEGRAEA